MQMIAHAGVARGHAYHAIEQAAAGDFAGAAAALAAADQELKAAHREHLASLAGEARGEQGAPSLLLMHAEDQLMTAISERGLIEQIVGLYRRLDERGPGGS